MMTISENENRSAELQREIESVERDIEAQRLAAADYATAAKRQARCDVVTISDTGWLANHTARFIHLARRAMPDARVHLVHVGYSPADIATHAKTLDQFNSVKHVPFVAGEPGYLSYNRPRYGLCELFGLDSVIYIDPDVDIVADISPILDDCTKPLGWCRSPIEPAGFSDAMTKCGLPVPKVWPNSGTLVMRGNFSEQYRAAAARAIESGIDQRMVGNFAFAVMLAGGSVESQEIPYKYGSIWWDGTNYARALCLHYCNDKGKARRLALDSVWVA